MFIPLWHITADVFREHGLSVGALDFYPTFKITSNVANALGFCVAWSRRVLPSLFSTN